jgi:hypothetical protein
MIAWGSNHLGCEGELAKARTLFVLSALLVLVAASMGGSPAGAQDKDNCLPAPTGKAAPGSHWHYRTDPVKQTKCWYLRSDAEAAQPATAATDGADAAGGPPRPAAPVPKPGAADASRPAAADPSSPAAHPHKPRQATRAGGGAKPPQPGTQNPAATQAGPGATAWPDPQPQGANGPPPAQAAGGGAAWPDPQQSPAGSPNSPWPDPPSSATSGPGDPTTTSSTSDVSAGQDTGGASGAGETAAEAAQAPATQSSDVSGRAIFALAVAVAFVVVGTLMRWLLGRFFARRRRVAAERREPLWETGEYVMPDALARVGQRPLGHVDPERLDAEAKQALRKLLRTLERNAA